MEVWWLFFAVGFVAQLVDGALGMAYGVLTNTALLAIGLLPAQASALVHTAEVFTTSASAASHIYHRNVDWRLVARIDCDDANEEAMKRGRPSRYSYEIADTICERLAVEGESLRTICADPAMPTKSTVFRWLARYEEFRDMYGVAREWQTTVL